MVDLGVPEMAAKQASDLNRVRPNNGLAWAVSSYDNARKGDTKSALSEIVKAVNLAPDDPFVLRTAGQLMAWYDHSADKSAIPANLQNALLGLVAQAERNPEYVAAYQDATHLYESGTATQPSAENSAARRWRLRRVMAKRRCRRRVLIPRCRRRSIRRLMGTRMSRTRRRNIGGIRATRRMVGIGAVRRFYTFRTGTIAVTIVTTIGIGAMRGMGIMPASGGTRSVAMGMMGHADNVPASSGRRSGAIGCCWISPRRRIRRRG